jgi:hypothetical protein
MPQSKERKREYMRGYMRTWQPSQKAAENKRKRSQHHEASLYAQRKSEGLCVDCGTQARSGLTLCQQCQERQVKRKVKARQSRKLKAVQYLGGKCVDCGLQTDFMSVYDFHHKDANTKNDSITAMLSHYRPWETIQAELDKCLLLCANCHRIRHELRDYLQGLLSTGKGRLKSTEHER